LACGIGALAPRIGHAQANQPAAGYALPEPIYWKQTLFQIPYQWSSASEPGAAHNVVLHLSKDRGASWQKISEAKPNVSSFNYRAERDGEYWFAVRTIDHQLRPWPTGDLQPELRVIVDTTMPRIEGLQAETRGSDTIEITWSGFDANLDPASWRFEAQYDPNGLWQAVPLTNFAPGPGAIADVATASSNGGRATWQLSPGQAPIAIRATVSDRAGNSATFRSEVRIAAVGPGIVTRLPAIAPGPLSSDQPIANPFVAATAGSPALTSPASSSAMPGGGWVSSSEATTAPALQPAQRSDQSWPASTTAHVPFRLWSSGVSTPTDSVTSYGTPVGIDSLQAAENDLTKSASTAGVSAQFATAKPSASPPITPPFQPLQPFRQASQWRQDSELSESPDIKTAPSAGAGAPGLPPTNAYAGEPSTNGDAKLIGSRTFALEYDLEDVGRWGVSKVELWGTRDEGQSWRMVAEDDDHRSPLIVTVDDEGRYGFRIVVHSAGGPEAPRPQPGDAPELWVAVDVRHPVAELTAVERGAGNDTDQLILHWRALDDNLDALPISLYYSSHLNGPWSAIATNLQNTGQYAWRVGRHVPTRFYLRLEVRDAAGNLAAFNTREPIEFTAAAPSARLNSAESIVPSTSGGASYR
jgi:hypothetical protein